MGWWWWWWWWWSTPRPIYFTPRKETRCPLYRRLGGHQGRSGRVGKIWPPQGFNPRPPLGFDSRSVQPVASRCTLNRQNNSRRRLFQLFINKSFWHSTQLLSGSARASVNQSEVNEWEKQFFVLLDIHMAELSVCLVTTP